MNICARIEPDLSAFVDGELAAAEQHSVAQHVENCPHCAGVIDRLRAVGAVLRRWDAEETRYASTNAFRARVMQRVGAPTDAAPCAVVDRRPAPRPVLVRAAAAAVLVVAAGAAVSLAWPRAGMSPSDIAAIEARIVAQVEAQRLAGDGIGASGGAAAHTSATAHPFDVPRIAPLETVVTPGEDTSHGDTTSYLPPVEDWQEYGGTRILSDVYPEYDRFRLDRRDVQRAEDDRRQRVAAVSPSDHPTAEPASTTVLGRYLEGLRVSTEPVASYQQVQVWAILDTSAVARRDDVPIAADEALDLKILRVREGPRDDALIVENRDRRGREVLLMAGDVLSGARRDRVVAEDVILQPGQTRSLRALATGESRRTPRRTFTRSDGVAPLRVRALLSRGCDQAVFDAVVADTLPRLGSLDAGGSLNAVLNNDSLLSRADLYVEAFSGRLDGPSVVGFAVAAGRDVLGVEVFDDHATFAAERPRVLRSYVLEALGRQGLVGMPPGRIEVEQALVAAARAANVGTGGDLSVFVDLPREITGHGLVLDGKVRHAVVFAGGDVVPNRPTAHRGNGPATPGGPVIEGDSGTGAAPMRGTDSGGGGIGTGDR